VCLLWHQLLIFFICRISAKQFRISASRRSRNIQLLFKQVSKKSYEWLCKFNFTFCLQ
jgi:hypothetical protein